MSKLNERLTLVANLSVVAGIVFLAAEMRQNTQAIQAQTRHAMSEMQIEVYGYLSNPDLADVAVRGTPGRDALNRLDRVLYGYQAQMVFREWENSHYQYEQGLFLPQEYEARRAAWPDVMGLPGAREVWSEQRHTYSPSFRAEIDRIVAEVEQAQ
jgi:hypothetical protein